MNDTPINLNRARKNRARAEKMARADANARKFGRTKTERQIDVRIRDAHQDHIDAHRIEPEDTDADRSEE